MFSIVCHSIQCKMQPSQLWIFCENTFLLLQYIGANVHCNTYREIGGITIYGWDIGKWRISRTWAFNRPQLYSSHQKQMNKLPGPFWKIGHTISLSIFWKWPNKFFRICKKPLHSIMQQNPNLHEIICDWKLFYHFWQKGFRRISRCIIYEFYNERFFKILRQFCVWKMWL